MACPRPPATATTREALDVVADRAPDLHEVLDAQHAHGAAFVCLDGTLIATTAVHIPAGEGKSTDAWYSGKHHRHGGNAQVLTDHTGFPIWTSPVSPGSTHDLTAARQHVLPALYPAAAQGLKTLTDKGYQGAGIGICHPIKGHGLAADTVARNRLITQLRAPAERATPSSNASRPSRRSPSTPGESPPSSAQPS